jgi:hypothetical protein
MAIKPTKAQLAALELLPVEASLDRYGCLLERIGKNGGFIGTVRGVRYTTFEGLVSRKLAKKVKISDRRWRYELQAAE